MGTVKSFFSTKEYLYSYIQANDTARAAELIKNHPELINQQLTEDSKCTPLSRAVWRKNQALVTLFLGMGADPGKFAGRLTPLMIAASRDCLRIIQLLIEYKADPSTKTQDAQALDCLDFAILYGNFSVARYLHIQLKMSISRDRLDYVQLAKAKRIYYVNYAELLKYVKLTNNEEIDILPNFFKPAEKDNTSLQETQEFNKYIKKAKEVGGLYNTSFRVRANTTQSQINQNLLSVRTERLDPRPNHQAL